MQSIPSRLTSRLRSQWHSRLGCEKKSHRRDGCATAALLASAFLTAPAVAQDPPQPETIDMNWAGLNGLESEGGTIGTGSGEASGFEVGRYIVVNDHLVLRATAEVENTAQHQGTPQGHVASLFVASGEAGLGVGSLADTENPGSMPISGGGPHGAEVVHMLFYDDALITNPQVVPAESIVLEIDGYETGRRGPHVSLVLFHADGTRYLILTPEMVVPHMVAISGGMTRKGGKFRIMLADIPEAVEFGAVRRFDLRCGWYDPAYIRQDKPEKNGKGYDFTDGLGMGAFDLCHEGTTIQVTNNPGLVQAHIDHGDTLGTCDGAPTGALSGGHFWLTQITFTPEDLAPEHLVDGTAFD